MPYRSPYAAPGYGRIVPILLAVASLVFLAMCIPALDRNEGFEPMDLELHARVIDYVDDMNAAEGQLLRVRQYRGEKPLGIVDARDDRPWRTFAPDDRVHLLVRAARDPRSRRGLEYAVDDFRAKWGRVIGLGGAAVLCDLVAVLALILGRKRPSAAERFPPVLPASVRSSPGTPRSGPPAAPPVN